MPLYWDFCGGGVGNISPSTVQVPLSGLAGEARGHINQGGDQSGEARVCGEIPTFSRFQILSNSRQLCQVNPQMQTSQIDRIDRPICPLIGPNSQQRQSLIRCIGQPSLVKNTSRHQSRHSLDALGPYTVAQPFGGKGLSFPFPPHITYYLSSKLQTPQSSLFTHIYIASFWIQSSALCTAIMCRSSIYAVLARQLSLLPHNLVIIYLYQYNQTFKFLLEKEPLASLPPSEAQEVFFSVDKLAFL